MREPAIRSQTMYPTWPSQVLCAMLGQRARDPLSLLHPIPSEDWLWQSRFVPTLSTTTEEAGAMGGSFQLHRLLALQPQAWGTISKLTGRSGRSSRLCPSRQNPPPHSLWKTGNTGPRATSIPSSSTSSCPTYGRFQHLRVTVSLNPLDQRSLLLASDA